MAKVILKDGSEEYLSPAAARAKVASGEASFPLDPHAGYGTTYVTRELVAEKPKKAKPKRKRRTKAQIEAEAAADEAE